MTARRGEGVYTAFARLKYPDGTTTDATADFTYDSSQPADGSVTAAAGVSTITLSWSGFSDNGTGIARNEVHGGQGGIAPRCSKGEPVWSGTATSTSFSGLLGELHSYRVCAVDRAGHRSSGSVARATPDTESDPPVVSAIQLDDGSGWTGDREVMLTAVVSDASGVAGVCTTEGNSCTNYVPWTPPVPVELSGGSDDKTLHVYFEDIHGNRTPSAESAKVTFDNTRPDNGEVAFEPREGAAAISWSGFSDAHSELASYRAVWAEDRAPATATRAPSRTRAATLPCLSAVCRRVSATACGCAPSTSWVGCPPEPRRGRPSRASTMHPSSPTSPWATAPSTGGAGRGCPSTPPTPPASTRCASKSAPPRRAACGAASTSSSSSPWRAGRRAPARCTCGSKTPRATARPAPPRPR